jgi:hypothetical protein
MDGNIFDMEAEDNVLPIYDEYDFDSFLCYFFNLSGEDEI